MIHQQPNPGIHYEYIIPGDNVISPQLLAHRRPGKMLLFPVIKRILLSNKLMEKFLPLNSSINAAVDVRGPDCWKRSLHRFGNLRECVIAGIIL